MRSEQTRPATGKSQPGGRVPWSRRDLCRHLLMASSFPLLGGGLVGCAGSRSMRGGQDAALLLPLTGSRSALGQNMSRAASLVTVSGPDAAPTPTFDTGASAESAGASAQRAVEAGARMLFGPLSAEQTPAVLAKAGRTPVVTFSNDDRLTGQGAFVMGITPAQSVATAFSYARAQGVRRVALVAAPGPLGMASADAARRIAAAGGMTLTAVLVRDGADALTTDLRASSGGTLPDAVFLPDGGAGLEAFAGALAGSGVQLMGGVQWGVRDIADVASLKGAWFAAPPPAAFVDFLESFESRFGEAAGIVTALGHDAALTAAYLGNAGNLDRSGLTREEGFTGVLGAYRFLKDGHCERDLAVLTIEDGRIVAIGEITGT